MCASAFIRQSDRSPCRLFLADKRFFKQSANYLKIVTDISYIVYGHRSVSIHLDLTKLYEILMNQHKY